MPFAAPPERFAPPESAREWSGVREATSSGASCPQKGLEGVGEFSVTEDCLYVDVTAGPGKAKPVMVWLHGGAGIFGSGSMYDARRLAREGVVVMAPNYRLGAFGLLALPGLRGGGDFATADQVAALRWARANAAAFGGDPENVTVFGESQGAFTICALLGSTVARGLFDKAIMQSGACDVTWPRNGFVLGAPPVGPYATRREALRTGRETLRKYGCPDVDCLREVSVDDLLDAPASRLPLGGLLPDDPAAALARAPGIPVLSGGTREEATGTMGDTPVVGAQRTTLLRQTYGRRRAALVGEEYAPDPFQTIISDAAWACPTLRTNETLSERGPTFAFEFDGPKNGHASELPYLFGGEDGELSDAMVRAWTTFARTGEPGWDAWPVTQRFNEDEVAPADVAADHHCDFWAAP